MRSYKEKRQKTERDKENKLTSAKKRDLGRSEKQLFEKDTMKDIKFVSQKK